MQKPSERIKQLSKDFFNTYKYYRSPIEDILEYLDEQAEQHAKKSSEKKPCICNNCGKDVDYDETCECHAKNANDKIKKEMKEAKEIYKKHLQNNFIHTGICDCEMCKPSPSSDFKLYVTNCNNDSSEPQNVLSISEINKIIYILDGIDRTEIDNNGWWETSIGAEFGKRKLEEIRILLKSQTSLVPLDRQLLWFRISMWLQGPKSKSISKDVDNIVDDICQKFGQPKVLSVEEIIHIMNKVHKNGPIKTGSNPKISEDALYRIYEVIPVFAEAIHEALNKKEIK